MKKLFCSGLIVLSFWSIPCIAQNTNIVSEIQLDPRNRLVVSNVDDEGLTFVELLGADGADYKLLQKIVIGNAVTFDDSVVVVDLDELNDALEVVVSAHIRTSNYGARQGVVVYKRGFWWRFAIVPDEKFVIHEGEGNNAPRIELQGKRYAFRNGFFLPPNAS